MAQPKKERNQRLIKLRQMNPKKWSWGKLALEFNISRPTAYMIYKKASLLKKDKMLVSS